MNINETPLNDISNMHYKKVMVDSIRKQANINDCISTLISFQKERLIFELFFNCSEGMNRD
jgi:hypothetical protein